MDTLGLFRVPANPNEDRSGKMLFIIILVTVMATIAVLLRFVTRRKLRQRVLADDCFSLAALVVAYAVLATEVLAIKYGVGKHALRLNWPTLMNTAKAIWATELTYVTSLFLTKCSMLCFYRRIFGTIDTTFSTAVVSVAIFNFIAWIAVFSIFTFQCTPIIYTWDRTLVGGRCLPNNVLFWSTSSINIATDIVIVILPIPIVWSMRLTIYQKLAVTGVFLLGGFVCICSIIRIPNLFKLDYSDPTFTDYGASIWSTVEVNIAIVSACLPPLHSLFAIGRRISTPFKRDPSYRLNQVLESTTTRSSMAISVESAQATVEQKPPDNEEHEIIIGEAR